MPKSEAEVRDQVKKLLVDTGIKEGDAGYLADLYSKSDKGKEHQKAQPDAKVLASNCSVPGILPTG